MTLNHDQAQGMLLGLAIGDALGTTLEFSRPTKANPIHPIHDQIKGGGPTGVPAGYFTDDTSMAIAIADSITERDEFDPAQVMYEFQEWRTKGKHSPSGRCVDIGGATRASLDAWGMDFDRPFVGSIADYTSGNGSIMRLAPIVIWNRHSYEDAIVDAVRQSMLTHASEKSVRYAQAMAAALFHGQLDGVYGEELGHPEKFDDRECPYSGGYVKESFSASCYAVRNSSGFKEALIKAVNYGFDADSTGAVTGQIAGRIYGLKAIPQEWLNVLAWKDKLTDMASQLWARAPTCMAVT